MNKLIKNYKKEYKYNANTNINICKDIFNFKIIKKINYQFNNKCKKCQKCKNCKSIIQQYKYIYKSTNYICTCSDNLICSNDCICLGNCFCSGDCFWSNYLKKYF
jgi:hypothetical protein